MAVPLRHAHQLGDRLERQLGRDLGDEVALAALAPRLVDDPRGPLLERAAQAVDHARGEAAGDDLAQPGVLRRVHVQEQARALEVELLGAEGLVEPDDRAVGVGGEQLVVARDLLDVRVPADHPEAVVVEPGAPARLRVPPGPPGAAERGELGERDPLGQQVGAGEVEVGGDGGSVRISAKVSGAVSGAVVTARSSRSAWGIDLTVELVSPRRQE